MIADIKLDGDNLTLEGDVRAHTISVVNVQVTENLILEGADGSLFIASSTIRDLLADVAALKGRVHDLDGN